MNLLKKIKQVFTASSKQVKMATSAVVAVTILFTGVAFAGWTPDRAVFNWDNPAERVGSLNGPRMNAFINTPHYGDERAFFDARKEGETSSKDVYNYVTRGEREVILRTYVHNGANETTNASSLGVAKDAKVKIALPTETGKSLRARSHISISNPAPNYPAEVTDSADLTDSINFSVKYVPGSAKIYTRAHPNSTALSDNIVTTGASIGYDQMNGTIPGCFEFQATVEIKVKIVVPETDIQKQVRKAGTTQYGELATVKPGDKVQWMIRQDMKGTAVHNNVRVFDALPDHLTIVPGSVRWIYRDVNGNDQDVKMSDTDLFTKQVNFGTWNSNTWFFLRFDTTAKGDFEGCEIVLTNQARSNTQQSPEEQRDNAQVKIVKENCVPEQPEKPQFACELLTLKSLGDRRVRLTVSATASGGAEIKRYIYNFGDGSEPLTTDDTSVEYTYNRDGTFNSSVQVVVEVDGEEQIITGNNCVASITFKPGKPPVVPPTTPGVPTELPDTGAGGIVAAFVAVTVGSSVAYFVAVRRFAGL